MRLIRTVLLVSLLATAVTVGGATAAQAKLAVGIADNKSDMFTDPRFTALKVKYVRVMVPYDAMHDFAQRTWLDGWMAGAKADGLSPLVTFDRSRKRTSHNPSAAQMATSLKDVRKRYPFVKEFATWNEANINKQPETVARWWLAMRKACPTLHDPRRRPARPQQRRHVGPALRQGGQADPEGLGPAQLRRRQPAARPGTRKLLKAVKGEVWFTETGGVVSRNNESASRSRPARPTRPRPPSSCSRRWPSSARACSASTCITGTRAWPTSRPRSTMTTGRGTRA